MRRRPPFTRRERSDSAKAGTWPTSLPSRAVIGEDKHADQIHSAATVRSFTSSPVLTVVLGSKQQDLHLVFGHRKVLDAPGNDHKLAFPHDQNPVAQLDAAVFPQSP